MLFRVADIKILEGCISYVRKILKEGGVYLFSSRYKEDVHNELTISIDKYVTGYYYAQKMHNLNRGGNAIEVSINAL